MGLRFVAVMWASLLLASVGTNAFAQPSADAEISKGVPGKLNDLLDHVKSIFEYLVEYNESRKAGRAVDAELVKLKPGETKTFEVVSSGAPIIGGGKFVRVQEVTPGPKTDVIGTYYSKPFELGPRLPSASDWTPQQKLEMQEKAARFKQEQETVRAAEDAQVKLMEIRSNAEKARAAFEASQAAEAKAKAEEDASKVSAAKAAADKAAAQAAADKAAEDKAVAQAAAAKAAAAKAAADKAAAQVAAAKAAREAAKAERDYENNGRALQRRMEADRDRFKSAGGNYRSVY